MSLCSLVLLYWLSGDVELEWEETTMWRLINGTPLPVGVAPFMFPSHWDAGRGQTHLHLDHKSEQHGLNWRACRSIGAFLLLYDPLLSTVLLLNEPLIHFWKRVRDTEGRWGLRISWITERWKKKHKRELTAGALSRVLSLQVHTFISLCI